MRALTLTQPWAGLVASGIKLVENRPRKMIKASDFGKPFAIHASREIDASVYARIASIAPDVLPGYGETVTPEPPWFPLSRVTSAIIGVATVERCVSVGAASLDFDDPNSLDIFWLGDQRRWFFGPIGYVLRDVRALERPLSCRGNQGFWTLTPELERGVLEQLGAAA